VLICTSLWPRFLSTRSVIASVTIECGNDHDVCKGRDLEEIFEFVLRAEVVDVVITQRERMVEDNQADGVSIAADPAKSDGVFAGSRLRRGRVRALGRRADCEVVLIEDARQRLNRLLMDSRWRTALEC